MLQGTGSDVGKSLLVAGLCRALANRGLRVRPFKAQNMSNNAAVTSDGGEIGRAQATQAFACRVPPSVHMNPVLLKPQSNRASQLVLRGRVAGELRASDYRGARKTLLAQVRESYRLLRDECDLVICEGAGSPAEINLRAGDIANMGFARAEDIPVLLVGDIDRGGVIASLVGTQAVIDAEDAAMIRGFLINKFRGDPALFVDGYAAIAARTGWRGFGVVPWLAAAERLPSEDSLVLQRRRAAETDGRIVIACPITPRIANFDDLEPWRLEPEVDLVMVYPGEVIPAEADLIVLTGSKATLADLASLRENGWDIDIRAHHRRGGRVIGICGGYQMLGRRLADPLGVEGPPQSVEGLGLLDVETVFMERKELGIFRGTAFGAEVTGYEIHMGVTDGPDRARAWISGADGKSEGAASGDGLVHGTYVHGLFNTAAERRRWLKLFGGSGGNLDHDASLDAALDDIAGELERHLDIAAMIELARAAP